MRSCPRLTVRVALMARKRRRERGQMMKVGVDDFCVYCGATEDLTDDHVPPECIFPKGRRTGLVKVRACRRCNGGASKDDEYFRMMLCMSEEAGESPEA